MVKLSDFIKTLKMAQKSKTLYVMGGFGAPLNAKNKKRYSNNNEYNRNPTRAKMINEASEDTFAFDCVCLIKGCLSGWNGDLNRTYGGATYPFICPDYSADGMFTRKYVYGISNDFTKITPGAVVHMSGHVGVYIGCGQVIESSPKWKNCVQVSYLGNLPEYKKGNFRIWSNYGYLPCVDYSEGVKETPIKETIKEEKHEKRKYVVMPKDNLTRIAAEFDTTIEKIIEDNIKKYPRMTRNFICVGWVLEV